MNFKDYCEKLLPEKEITDTMKMNYLNYIDINTCFYVCGQLFSVDFDSKNVGRTISLKQLFDMSLNEVKILGNNIWLMLSELISNVDINIYDSKYESCYIDYPYYVENGSKIISKKGKVLSYNIPNTNDFFEYSVFGLCHEHMHVLKDTNYEEYKDRFILGETIPLLFELVMFNPDDDLRKNMLKERMMHLFRNSDELLFADKMVNNNIVSYDYNLDFYQQRSIYEYVRSKIGNYLNSFYYAIILYSMYKETPKKILDLVSKVLKHEMTTLQVLEYLDIYGDIKGNVFEKELKTMKKILR